MMLRILLAFLLVQLNVQLPSAFAQSLNDIEWTALNTKNLQPSVPNSFSEATQSARIIALGESTHGSGSLFRTRNQLIMSLVKAKRIKTVTYEASYGNSLLLNDFVLGKEVDPKLAIKSLNNWPWRTVEMLELAQALRDHNLKQKNAHDRVMMIGFDLQQIAGVLNRITQNHSKELAHAGVRPQLNYLLELSRTDSYFSPWADSTIAACVAVELFLEKQQLNAEMAFMLSNLRAARNIFSKEDMLAQVLTRDSLMAQMALDILQQRGGSMVMWGHNGHIMRYAQEIALGLVYKTLGKKLNDVLGHTYHPIALDFYAGTFRAVDPTSDSIRTFTAEQAPENSITASLATLSSAELYFPLSSSKNEKYFEGKKFQYRQIEAVYDPMNSQNAIADEPIKELFDGWIWIRQSEASVDLK